MRESRVNRILSSVELFSRLRGLGRDWDSEMEKLLATPPNIYENSGGTSQYFSKDIAFGISDIVLGLVHSAAVMPKQNEYGIALYEKANTTYFVLVDMSRRIVVKERIQSIQSDPPEQSWGAVKQAIKYAVSVAEKAGADSFVLFDGTPRIIKIEKPEDSWNPPPVYVPKAK